MGRTEEGLEAVGERTRWEEGEAVWKRTTWEEVVKKRTGWEEEEAVGEMLEMVWEETSAATAGRETEEAAAAGREPGGGEGDRMEILVEGGQHGSSAWAGGWGDLIVGGSETESYFLFMLSQSNETFHRSTNCQ